MRILFVADDLYPGFGGQASATQGHIQALVAAGHEVRAVAGAEPSPVEPPAGVLVERLPSWQLGTSQTRFALPSFARLAKHLEWADILHANTPTALAAAAVLLANRKRVPVVLGLHTQVETTELQVPVMGRFLGLLLHVWYRILFRGADLVVAPTKFAARAARVFTPGRIEVVSNGIDLSSWPAPELPTVEARRASEGSERRLLYLGRLSGEKRPDALVPLLAALPPGYRLLIAGQGPLRSKLETDIAAAGITDRVELLGFVSEDRKRALMATVDLFVMTSPAELQSLATLEAMAAGLPVAAFGHGSSAVPEFIAASGAGVVVDPSDPRAQAAAIEALVADPVAYASAARRAREFAEGHDVNASAHQLTTLYSELLAATRARFGDTSTRSGGAHA